MRSIRTKLVGMVAIAIIVPVIIAMFISYNYVEARERERGLEMASWSLERGVRQMERYVMDLSRMPTSLYANRAVLDILENGVGASLEQSELEIRRALLGMFLSREDISQMQLLILQDLDSFAVYKMKVSPRSKQGLSDAQRTLLLEPNRRMLLQRSRTMTPYHRWGPLWSDEQVVTLHVRIDKIETDTPLAILSIDIPSHVLTDQLATMQNDVSESLWFVNEQGAVFSRVGTNDTPSVLREGITSHDRAFYLTETFKIEDETLFVGKRIPDHVLIAPAAQTSLIILFVGLMALGLALAGASYVAMRVTTPIKTLTSAVWRVEQGDMNVNFDSLGNDEIGVLGKQFKKMVERIDDLIEREYKLALENRTNELRALQAQTNPHFLFNALQSIGTFALKGEGKTVYRLMTQLSDMMRYTMNSDESLVPLRREVKYLESYLQLQRVRFPEQFDAQILVSDELLDHPVPKMLLQPIAENYFKHGFERGTRQGANRFSVRIWRQGNMVMVECENNGVAISKKEEERLQTKIDLGFTASQETGGIGLKNIRDRLMLNYQQQAHFMIEAPTCGGFRVIMRFPAQREEDVS